MANHPLLDEIVLNAALMALDKKRAEIEEQIAEVRRQLRANGAGERSPMSAAPARKKRVLSAAARKRIGEATRRRWAAYRKAKD
jgi:hypothetical protein